MTEKAEADALFAQVTAQLVAADASLTDEIAKSADDPMLYVARARFRYETAVDFAMVAKDVAAAIGVDLLRGTIDDYARVLARRAALPPEDSLGLVCEAWINTASAAMGLGDLELAKDAATSAIHVLEKLDVTGQLAEFEEHAELRVRVLAEAHKIRGSALHYQGRRAEALGDYAKSLELAPDDAELWSSRAEALVEEGQFRDAIVDFGRAIDLGHVSPVTFCGRGVCHEALGARDRAAEDFTAALELDAHFEPAQAGLERLAASRGPAN